MTNSFIIQNYQLLLNEIPSALINLSYAIYPTDKTYNDIRFIYNKLFKLLKINPHVFIVKSKSIKDNIYE